jgi:hypothetical protein
MDTRPDLVAGESSTGGRKFTTEGGGTTAESWDGSNDSAGDHALPESSTMRPACSRQARNNAGNPQGGNGPPHKGGLYNAWSGGAAIEEFEISLVV